MKKLIMLAMALAIVAIALPTAQAGETANLGLSVTFAPPPEPLTIWTEPAGSFQVEAGQTFLFKLIGEDKDAAAVTLQEASLPRWIHKTQETAYPNRIEAEFECAPQAEDAQADPYHVAFIVVNDSGEQATMTVDIIVPVIPVISIELDSPHQVLNNVQLGQTYPVDIAVRNIGNVSVNVDIGYGPQADVLIHHGLEQGMDNFITALGGTVLPPNQRLAYDKPINPDEQASLELIYGAPTAVSISGGEPFDDVGNGIYDPGELFTDLNDNGQFDEGEPFIDAGNGYWDPGEAFTDLNDNGVWDPGASGHGVTYELRAYPAIVH
ncbi:MAG: hypothetical protein NTV07_00675 [Candidatus Omnitrophica bacterium]|nr:hypothetical protein [Candidatus Omnitrophota bacterium]